MNHLFVCIGCIATIGGIASPASLAGFNAPYVWAYRQGGTLNECIVGAQKALEANGFKVVEVVYGESKKSAVVYSEHTDKALGASIGCDPSEGRSSLAVSGMNDTEAWDAVKSIEKVGW